MAGSWRGGRAEVPREHIPVEPTALQHQKGTQMAPVPPVTKIFLGFFLSIRKLKLRAALPAPLSQLHHYSPSPNLSWQLVSTWLRYKALQLHYPIKTGARHPGLVGKMQ